MAIGITDDKHYKAIGEILKPYDTMAYLYGVYPEEMPDLIDMALGCEFDNGFMAGEVSGEEWAKRHFWIMYQNSGARETYTYAFSYTWDDYHFKPLFDINAKNVPGMFRECKITDLKGIIEKQGIEFNILASDISYFARLSTITRVPEIGKDLINMSNAFSNCSNLVSIDKLNTSKTAECNCNNAFTGCPKLEYVEFNEKFNPTSLNLSSAPKIKKECIVSLFNNLTTIKNSKVITLGTTNLNKLTETEKAIATQKGWTLA